MQGLFDFSGSEPAPTGQRIYTVSELTKAIKALIEGEPAFVGVMVKGEVSNFKHHASGHMYFTLKDERGRLKCVMFRGKNRFLRFRPEDGQSVVATGSLGVYEAAGEYQLYVDELLPAGQGELYLEFERLKERLGSEGLFDPDRKRPLPFLPTTVGVVTSPTGAAIRDIVSVLRRRYPPINIVLAPALVQGEGGPASVVQALSRLSARSDVDVIIVGRGGGSIEELWTFNDERVARAIAACAVPVVSAVGHETDVTIADFVADMRAATPSAAAELVVPEFHLLKGDVDGLGKRLMAAQTKLLATWRERLRYVQQRPVLTRPLDGIHQRMQAVDELSHRLTTAARFNVERQRRRLEGLLGRLDGLSPLGTLARGYAICQKEGDSIPLVRAAEVTPGERVRVRLHQGELACLVEETVESEVVGRVGENE